LVDKSADATAKRVSEGHDDLASDGDSLSGESEETKVQPQEQTIVYDEHGFIHNDDDLDTWPPVTSAVFRGWGEFLKIGVPVRCPS